MNSVGNIGQTLLIHIILVIIQKVQGSNIDTVCPRLFHQVFEGYAPVGNKNAGNYTEFQGTNKLWPCVQGCCEQRNNCNVAFIFNDICYHVQCITNEMCLPMKRSHNITTKLRMVLVNPAKAEEYLPWFEILKQASFEDFTTATSNEPVITEDIKSYIDKFDESDTVYGVPFTEKDGQPKLKNVYNGLDRFANDQYSDDSDMQMDESRYYTNNLMSCEVGAATTCAENEECVQLSPKSRQGICNCAHAYVRNQRDQCVKKTDNLLKDINTEFQQETDPSGSSSSAFTETSVKKLTVSVVSKNVRLPEQEVTLAAYTIPDEKSSGDSYKYLWSLVSQPSGDVNGTMSDQTKDNIHLSNLSEGLYRFKVIVTGFNLYGEAYANVTVSREKRINRPPEVIITPEQQTVKLPTSKAILDGSASTDDDKIKLWHWDLIQGPIGYQPMLPEISTLQLSDLTAPGNYTFKLTLTDSDNVQNSTTACITVLKANDYPPEANAGADVIVYLPHNNVTLNGSQSTDDREIVSWEWTKDSNDEAKAVDMQNTRTPYLQLSNLEKGIYTFMLKVGDASNQTSTAKVHVFVKPPTNMPPLANAGKNLTIILPQTWAILNASQSTDDVKIKSYHWQQLTGPNFATILNANHTITNVTGLTVGKYIFQINVINENGNKALDTVAMTVVQERNAPPVANAGGDQSATLPVNAIYLNGSRSTDDLGIVSYRWTREESSLAIGTTVGNSSNEPVLMLTNIVPGRYVFKLTVADAQGLTGTDAVSIIVQPDPMLLNLIELTFAVNVSVLTQSEVNSLCQKLELLLGDSSKIVLRDLKMEQKTGEAVIIFYVEKVSGIMSGIEVEKQLTGRFWIDSSILGMLVSNVRTILCQNECSGHGVCNPATRSCMCETFWMPDVFYFWGIHQANCDWSILYVVVGIFLGFFCASACCWGLTCLCRQSKKPPTRAKPQKYSLLGTQDDEVPVLTRGTSISDSDTDSDVLYETRTQPFLNVTEHCGGNTKFSVTRMGRRIKA